MCECGFQRMKLAFSSFYKQDLKVNIHIIWSSLMLTACEICWYNFASTSFLFGEKVLAKFNKIRE